MKKFLYGVLLLIGVTTLAGCTNSIKTTPAELGDTVYVDYVATYEKNGNLFDTTMADVLAEKKASPKRENYEPLKIVLGEENTDLLPIVQEALVGMKAGEIKTIVVTPDQGYGAQYDETKVQEVPYIVFEKSATPTTKGTIRPWQGGYAMIKDVVGAGKSKKVVMDTNDLETYSDLKFELFVRQVGGSSYKAETE